MKPALIAFALMLAGTAQAQVAVDCAVIAAPQALTARPTLSTPVAPELVAPRHRLGAPTGVLAQALDESLSVDQVLYRIRIAGCATVASATPAPVPGALPAAPASTLPVVPGAAAMPASTDPAAYKPRTEFDNTPWRFDMSQDGKRMTADEFTAWMEAKGVRVVKPREPVAVAPVGQAPASAAPPATVEPAAVTPPGEVDDKPKP